MNEDEIQNLQLQVRGLHKRLRQATPPVEGVSASAVRVLAAVTREGSEAGVLPGRLADVLHMTTSNVAAALGELERAGYVERKRDASDARRVAVLLSDSGRQIVSSHRALRMDGLRTAIETSLTAEEQSQLADVIPLLERVVDAVGVHPTDHITTEN